MRLWSCAVLSFLALGLTSIASAAAPLRVGIEINNEPISFVENGQPTGFVTEVVEAIAREMDLPVTPVSGQWDDLFNRFKAGEIDAIASLAYSPERDRFIDFSTAHLRLNGALFVRKDSRNLRQLSDLRTLRIALPPGGFTQEYLTRQGLDQHFVFVPSLGDSLQALADGKCDAVAATEIIAAGFVRKHRLKGIEASPVKLPGFFYELRMGVRAGDSDRLAMLNDGLARIRANGSYDRIYEKWIGPLEPRDLRAEELRPYLAPFILGLGAIIILFFWQRRVLQRLARQASALSQSEERLTLVMEGSEDGFWDWDLVTGKVERSHRWATMLGYSRSEIPASIDGGLELVHPEDQKVYRDHKTRLTSGNGNRDDIEYRMKAKSGEWRWILDRGKVVTRAPDGSPIRIAGTQSDITDLKKAQRELAQQEAQFRFIYENVPVGIAWVRRQQADTRLVNPAHERITGVSSSKSRDPANYLTATHPDDRERQDLLQARLYRGEINHFSFEKRYIHPDGHIVWALYTAHLYHDPITREAQEVTTLVDISGLKQADEERERLRLKMLDAQKLESLGVLAGGIAHDFNNLLTVILANASLARGEDENPATRAAHLTQIEAAARRAADLCRQMLAYAGGGNFMVERLEINRLVRDTAQLLQVSISKKAQLVVNLAPTLPAIDADASQLQQVVMNLVINASDALGDSQGEIRLTTRLGRPQPTATGISHTFDFPAGDAVCLEVNDTGNGMTPATLARMFDPFFTTKFAGRGLGLAAVLGIVRAHHGALTVESAPGQGTCFRVFIPAAAFAHPVHTRNTTQPMPVATAGGAILLADDEPIVLSTTDQLLRRAGYTTVLAINGNEAVRYFRANPNGFVAVLLDLTMPGLDGAEALRIIRSLNSNMPVLLMSGYSEQDVLARIRDQGSVPVLRKPFTHESLLNRLAEVMAG